MPTIKKPTQADIDAIKGLPIKDPQNPFYVWELAKGSGVARANRLITLGFAEAETPGPFVRGNMRLTEAGQAIWVEGKAKPSKFSVDLPVNGYVTIEVEAGSKKEAIEKALGIDWGTGDVQELNAFDVLCKGNVFRGVRNEARVVKIEGRADD